MWCYRRGGNALGSGPTRWHPEQFLHYCSNCWLPGHPSRLCNQKGASSVPSNAPSQQSRPAASAVAPKTEPSAPTAPTARKANKWLSRDDPLMHPSLSLDDHINYRPPPIHIDQLKAELSCYVDIQAREFLISGLTLGFNNGISHPPLISLECRNLLSARSDPVTVTSLLDDKLKNGYLIGPFNSPPFDTVRINPLGLAHRKFSSKKRLTVDMSAPHTSTDHSSLNDLIAKEEFSLSYVKIDDAISIINTLGPGVLMCKTDIKDAFKQVPIHPSLWPFQGIKWHGSYYFFTRLVFGCRSSPKIFDCLSSALNWIAIHNYNLPHTLHLLDDFLSIIPHHMDGSAAMARLRSMFHALHIPLSEAKTVGPTPSLEYLGIVIDSIAMEARLPQDKLLRITASVRQFLGISKCTQRELLSLIGHLGFATRVIPAGRTFMSRLFQAAYTVKQLHHRVYLNSECRKDLLMWHKLLHDWNGISLFLEREPTSAESLDLYTDASGAIGFGGHFQGKWFCGAWPPELASSSADPISIAFQELYPIVVAAILWSKHWSRRRLIFHSDNQATCHILNKGRSKCPQIMRLLRRLVLLATHDNFAFSAVHIPGYLNTLADSLSRLQIQKFRTLAPHAEPAPCSIPSDVMLDWPMQPSSTNKQPSAAIHGQHIAQAPTPSWPSWRCTAAPAQTISQLSMRKYWSISLHIAHRIYASPLPQLKLTCVEYGISI